MVTVAMLATYNLYNNTGIFNKLHKQIVYGEFQWRNTLFFIIKDNSRQP